MDTYRLLAHNPAAAAQFFNQTAKPFDLSDALERANCNYDQALAQAMQARERQVRRVKLNRERLGTMRTVAGLAMINERFLLTLDTAEQRHTEQFLEAHARRDDDQFGCSDYEDGGAHIRQYAASARNARQTAPAREAHTLAAQLRMVRYQLLNTAPGIVRPTPPSAQ